MKITAANYKNKEVVFAIDTYPDKSFAVSLVGKTTKAEVKAALIAMLPTTDPEEEKFNNLNISTLMGTDI